MQEFLAATINQSKLEREDHLKAAFEHFDIDGDGKITHAELTESLANLKMKEIDIKAILADVDKDGNGSIDYNEFCMVSATSRYACCPCLTLGLPAEAKADGSCSLNNPPPSPVPWLQMMRNL